VMSARLCLPSITLLSLVALPAARAADPTPPPAAAVIAAAVAQANDADPSAPVAPAAGQRVPWQGDPIPVALKVKAERRIDFPEPISDLDVPKGLEQQSRIVLTPTGQLHWTAQAPFEPARVLATSVSGTLYQLDVGARAGGEAPERLTITDPVLDAAAAAEANAPDPRARLERAAAALIPEFLKGETGGARAGGPRYAELARFALAHFTGPSRLIPKLDAARVAVRPIDTRAWLRVQSAYLTLRPLAQWKAGDLHVTALGVYNRATAAVPFEPRALRGELLFAAALHPTLGPQGSGHNGTVWAVVTRRPFNQALARGPALTLAR
jgi:integrating conjugative element protein (TIGR03749 family)